MEDPQLTSPQSCRGLVLELAVSRSTTMIDFWYDLIANTRLASPLKQFRSTGKLLSSHTKASPSGKYTPHWIVLIM